MSPNGLDDRPAIAAVGAWVTVDDLPFWAAVGTVASLFATLTMAFFAFMVWRVLVHMKDQQRDGALPVIDAVRPASVAGDAERPTTTLTITVYNTGLGPALNVTATLRLPGRDASTAQVASLAPGASHAVRFPFSNSKPLTLQGGAFEVAYQDIHRHHRWSRVSVSAPDPIGEPRIGDGRPGD